MSELLAVYPSPGAAAVAFGAVVGGLGACRSFTTAVNGTVGVAAVSAAAVAGLGPRAAAYRVSVKLGAALGGAEFVLAQRYDQLLLLVYGDAGQPDEGSVGAIAATAVARIGR